jgi:hypothetical protein
MSRSSRVDAAILTSLEDINQKLTAAAKSTREEKANKGVTLTNISYSTRDILDLVRAKGIERKALMHRGNNGLTVLFNCLKENINNSIVTDVLLIFQCLSDHKYKGNVLITFKHNSLSILETVEPHEQYLSNERAIAIRKY